MRTPDSPAKFKNPYGAPKRFDELRHIFAASATAQYLISEARRIGVIVLDSSENLEKNRRLGTCNAAEHEGNIYIVVQYSHNQPFWVLMHEFRHAIQMNTVIRKQANDIQRLFFPRPLRQQILYFAVTESDADLFQYKVSLEGHGHNYPANKGTFMEHVRLNCERYRNREMYNKMRELSLFPTARQRFMPSLFENFLVVCEDSADLKLLKQIALQKIVRPVATAAEKADDVAFMKEWIELICRNEDGSNYLLDGLSDEEQQTVFEEIYQEVIEKSLRSLVIFAQLKSEQAEKKERMQQAFSHSIAITSRMAPLI